MFEKELASKLKRIFKVKKVTYDMPSEPKQGLLGAKEQECIFVNVTRSKSTIKDGKQISKVEGTLLMLGDAEKLPFGFYSKAIYQADYNDVKDLFFYDMEGNGMEIQNIITRTCSFIYFYSGQYDPDLGNITSVELQETIDE